MKKTRGRPATGIIPIRSIRIKRWDEIPGNKSQFINALIDKELQNSDTSGGTIKQRKRK